MTVHTFNYSNCNSGGIDRIIGNSVCTEIFTYQYVQLFIIVTRDDAFVV